MMLSIENYTCAKYIKKKKKKEKTPALKMIAKKNSFQVVISLKEINILLPSLTVRPVIKNIYFIAAEHLNYVYKTHH